MEIETWLTFVAVSLALLATPGPITLLTVSYALNLDRRRAAPVIAGAVAGDFVAMSASLVGVGTLLSQSPTSLGILKLSGAAVLLWLGYRTLTGSGATSMDSEKSKDVPAPQVFWSGFTLAALHPSGIIFFTSFVPQFINTERAFAPQASILMATFLTIGGMTTAAWLLAADRARHILDDARNKTAIRRVSGSILLVIGFLSVAFALKPMS